MDEFEKLQKTFEETKADDINNISPANNQESNVGQTASFTPQRNETISIKANVESKGMPAFMAKEIFYYRITSLFTIIAGSIGMILLWVFHISVHLASDNMAMLVPLILIFAFLGFRVVSSLLALMEVSRDYKNVTAESRSGETVVPLFLLKVYRMLKVRVTNTNWVAITGYIVLGLILWGHSMFIQNEVIIEVPFIGWRIIDYNVLSTESWESTMFLLKVILGILIVGHGFILISTRTRTHKIDSFYGREIISNQEITLLKQKAHSRNLKFLIIVLIILFLVIWIPYKIIKRNKK